MAERRSVVVGIVAAAEGSTRELAEELANELPDELSERFRDVEWRIDRADAPPADPSAESRDLIEAVRRRLLDEDWDFAVGLTDLPLRVDGHPVNAYANPAHRVGLVSVPALGAIGIESRVREAVVNLIEGLLGEAVGDRGAARGRGRETRMGRRLDEVATSLGRMRPRDDGTIRFVNATLRGNLRLIVGMVRANQPSRLIVRLSRALVGALGTGAISLASSNIWLLADGMSWPRLAALGLISVAGTCAALIVAHGLWERASDPNARERVVLFNLTTCLTLGIGVVIFYVVLFAINTLSAGLLIPPGVFAARLGHSVGVEDYLQLAWLLAPLATIGGALGSLVESNDAVRAAAYRDRTDERTESLARDED
jgi:uncharacterized membrane protein